MSLQTIGLMKEALDKEGLKPHLMVQPVGYHTPDTGSMGFGDLPECPFGEFAFPERTACTFSTLLLLIRIYFSRLCRFTS